MFWGSREGDALFFPLVEFPAAATRPVSTPSTTAPRQPRAKAPGSGDISVPLLSPQGAGTSPEPQRGSGSAGAAPAGGICIKGDLSN